MKKLFILFLLAVFSVAHAGENEIRESLLGKFPNIGKLDHIVKTPYAGLYEVVIGDQLLYTDEKGQYLFDGDVIDVSTRADLTEHRRRQLFAVDFNKLPLDLAVKKVKGNGKRKMAYFTDPNCGYCKRLEKELSQVTDVTLYLFLYPVFNGSEVIVRNVLCSKDPASTWDNLMLKNIAPPAASCKTETAKVLELGEKLHVNGTPNLIFADGIQAPGLLPAAELEKRLNEAAKSK